MQSKTDWTQWVDYMQSLKLEGLVAWVLDAGAPITVLGAQVMYITQPFLGGKHTTAIAHMLESDEETQAFARVLRGGRAA